MKRWLGALWVVAGGCAVVRTPPSQASNSVLAPRPDVARAAPSSALAATPAARAIAPPAPLELAVTKVLTVRVEALALGDGTRIAVLSDPPYVGDARGLRPIPLPEALRAKPGETLELGIYFGRDNEPRLMGSRRTSAGDVAVYLRHLPSGWRDGREELGALGGAGAGGLWGTLGAVDPELVCLAGALCIIKRQSGWTTAPAGASTRIVTLQDGVLWGLDRTGVSGIDRRGWSLALPAPTPAWPEPSAFWATEGRAWVSAERLLFQFAEGAWSEQPSPVGVAAAFWGAARDSVWVVGSDGAAYFDGKRFRVASGIVGPLRVVRGRGATELWFGGDAGLFRATPR